MTNPIQPVWLLPVPKKSQIGPGADMFSNDCGAGSVNMVATGYFPTLNLTTDQVYLDCGGKNNQGLYITQLQTGLKKYGIPSEYRKDFVDVHLVFDLLRQSKPIIALIHYAPLVEADLTEKHDFKKAHFVVLIGIDAKFIYIHDPYTTEGNGEAVPVPIDLFMQAWKDATLDNNMAYQGLVPTKGIGEIVVKPPEPPPAAGAGEYKIKAAYKAVNFRYEPFVSADKITVLYASNTPSVTLTGKVENGYAEAIAKGKKGYIWLDYLEPVQ
jgi:Peptidase_C39 like family